MVAVAPVEAAERLRLTEIFLSLQGESRSVGWPTVFVRLTGCPLRCQYCDTAYAFHGGEWWEMDAILAEVARHGVRHVCVTGGEPLAQKRCLSLLRALCDAGYEVSLETSGALDVSAVDARVSRVLDLKTPGSLECFAQPAVQSSAADGEGPGEVRHLRAARTTSGRARMLAEHGLDGALRGAVFAQLRRSGARGAGRLDPRRPPAGALPDAAAQATVGGCPGQVSRRAP